MPGIILGTWNTSKNRDACLESRGPWDGSSSGGTNRGAESWPCHFLAGALNRWPDCFVPQFPPVENGGPLVVAYSQNYSEYR